jgi:hypothetical protein
MTLRDRIASIKKYLSPDLEPLKPIQFPHDQWAKTMLDQMKDSISMMDAMSKPEKIDPLTKALIVQHLSDISAKHPNVSLRRIISDVFADGVKDDYELLDKLIACDKKGFDSEKSGTAIRIRSQMQDHRLDAMSYMQRSLLDNAMMANNPPMRARLDGCSDPADTTGSSSAK